MPNGLLILSIALLGVVGWILGSRRARHVVNGKMAELHSRPHYYGASVLLWTVLPALALVLTWLVAEPVVISDAVYNPFPSRCRRSRPRCAR